MRQRLTANVALLEISEAQAGLRRANDPLRRFHRQLRERDLAVRIVVGRAAAGNALAVPVGSGPMIAALVEAVFAWLGAGSGRTVTITRGRASIELSAPSPESRQELIEWLMGHVETAC